MQRAPIILQQESFTRTTFSDASSERKASGEAEEDHKHE
jgi:hypothetical protein